MQESIGYSRNKHFIHTLSKYNTLDDDIPLYVIECIEKANLPVLSRSQIRSVLIKNGFSQYLDRIPMIICKLDKPIFTCDQIEQIMKEYDKLDKDSIKCISADKVVKYIADNLGYNTVQLS